mmetsp:Transcript_30777/g.86259  ORF Transcript_30777/g.86259 Transcript_30777/m.86259 type:complete len:258 (-) Transcript_30777:335-1108(-)
MLLNLQKFLVQLVLEHDWLQVRYPRPGRPVTSGLKQVGRSLHQAFAQTLFRLQRCDPGGEATVRGVVTARGAAREQQDQRALVVGVRIVVVLPHHDERPVLGIHREEHCRRRGVVGPEFVFVNGRVAWTVQEAAGLRLFLARYVACLHVVVLARYHRVRRRAAPRGGGGGRGELPGLGVGVAAELAQGRAHLLVQRECVWGRQVALEGLQLRPDGAVEPRLSEAVEQEHDLAEVHLVRLAVRPHNVEFVHIPLEYHR